MLLFIGNLNIALNLANAGTPVTWNLEVANFYDHLVVCL